MDMLGNMKCRKENHNYLENIETMATIVHNKNEGCFFVREIR